MPGGVISASRRAAPPVSFRVGCPVGRLITPISRQNTPRLRPGAERLGAGLLGGETLGVGGRALGAAFGFLLFDRREDAVDEALAVTRERLFDAPDIDEIAAKPEDHEASRAWSMMARMRWIAPTRPVKTASPTRK